ncbi:MAG: diguanylate cyclase domain-containing protein, partial [Acidimicrobiales bacterium]
ALAGAGQAAVEHRLGRPVGSQRWVHSTVTRIDTPNSGVRLIVKLEDITERREALEELRYLADHDPLTGLPNRRFALERLASLLKARSARTVTVLFCDLDGFKAVNDHLGHRAGDELLVHVARRLDSVIRPGELLCRLGGDEFVIISSLADPLSSAPVIAERCISALADPFSVAGNRVAISMSVGIASSAGDETDAATLIAGADTALYGAKGQGGGGWGWRSAPSRSTGDRAATPPGPA